LFNGYLTFAFMNVCLAYWVHDLDPFIVRFPEGWWLDGIRWYGIAYLLGFFAAVGLLRLYYKYGRSPFNPDQQGVLMTGLILGVLIGGRMGYMLFYDFQNFIHQPWTLFYIWQGGMASHGGFMGVFIAILWFAKSTKTSPFLVGDIVVTLAPPGILFGRLANFINGEIWGTVTDVSWAVIFPRSAAWANMPVEMIAPRHPVSLYAAFLEGLVLLLYTQLRFWKKRPLPVGCIAGEFLAAYAVLRIVDEFFREPDASLLLGMSRGQFYSLFLLIAGVGIVIYSRLKRKSAI